MHSIIMEQIFILILCICFEWDVWGHAMQVYDEKQTAEQIEMLLLKNICFYTCISYLPIVPRDNQQKLLLVILFYNEFVILFVKNFRPYQTWF